MSKYMIQQFFHRQVAPGEVELLIENKRGLWLVSEDGTKRKFYESPDQFNLQQWKDRCNKGQVFVVTHVNWVTKTEEELLG